MKTEYTFKKADKGIFGDAFEMAIKATLSLPNADTVSPAGREDFRFCRKCYDCKQNGSVLQYAEGERFIKGSNRVLYATHIEYAITAETEDTLTISVDLENTEIFCVDRYEFIDFLKEAGLLKINAERGQVNVQTGYVYKSGKYHGRTSAKIREWCYENALEDDPALNAIFGF